MMILMLSALPAMKTIACLKMDSSAKLVDRHFELDDFARPTVFRTTELVRFLINSALSYVNPYRNSQAVARSSSPWTSSRKSASSSAF